jgi:hypothetical protein
MDALLIPVFVLVVITALVLFPALLFYAIPVRASGTLVLKEMRNEQTVIITWWPLGIRTSRVGESVLSEVLFLGRVVFSHPGVPGRGAKTESEDTGGPGNEGKRDVSGTPAMVFPDIPELIHFIQRLAGPAGAFSSAFWQQTRFVSATGTVTLGLGDPALTGEVCGMYWASRFVLLASRISVELEPVFDRAVLELDITVRIKVKHPLLVLLAGIRLALHPAVREVMSGAKQRSRGVAAA